METKKLLKNDSLWNRIQSFSIDDTNSDFPFSKKLAKEENWSSGFTQKAIDEYKKFVYLCCILPNGASPSEIVDKVWHMHLIYTQNYWEKFCPIILQQKLHHNPSKGGSEEKLKHINWFEDTLQSYREIFGQEPPEEIWKKKEKSKNRRFWLKGVGMLSVLSLFFILNSCSKDSDNLFFSGLMGFIIFVVIFFISGSFKNDKKDKNKGDGDSWGSCGGSSSSCSSSSCGSSCGSGCGGCGGGGD
ncbi:glycine-rich domain-containing protein [Chryseobacterium oryctis]|uniref:TIGR04222 domain-containing protein n=1 Tax=Chryseobacterium oryctis TaxID=2952618 RepID=A0ABT3HLL0_9FLAO|nr:hypothetical protein [Chryseobacterium oryctis]MCW3160672.1 hypothetical protein [Chryseobacterium oryctis]